ncbi:cupredoxin domain-containing protein [Tumebacillus sp. ITR2]|uniref:Cupredoxin domain-containing protein n=1 Tax=Tumebacillus amylolyticus TaxID=2801339 RepID=A0ABS1JAX3_9BACL|nr:cupredoxin domain-containing protein [Tumebacillus amylolyticus]MBL0386758.1 cupredoxin domain-containing protein [Tumebacillus amylolyticus]
MNYTRCRKWLLGTTVALFAAALTAPDYVRAETHTYTNTAHIADKKPVAQQEYWIVTNEIKSPAKDGVPEMEVYRWDPGFLVVQKGKPVTLHFYGVKGKAHPFEIQGLGVKGDVQKGKVTTVKFTPDKVGTFPIVCLTHPTLDQHGPMVGYLRVEE